MSNVYNIRTGEVITHTPPKPQKTVIRLIESLYQRRHQISDLIFMAYDSNGNELYGVGADDFTARAMASYLDDQVRFPDDE